MGKTCEEWIESIRNDCETAGTYRLQFENVIRTLAEIMVKRDEVMAAYDGEPIVMHTNSHCKTNRAKNPALMLWADLNAQALQYWKELGLTPMSFKKMGVASIEEEKGSALVEALKAL